MEKVKNGDTILVNYTGKLLDGTVFDSSLTEGRGPLKVTLGKGQVIRGFENGLLDMSVGESKTINIEVNDAYGASSPDMIIEITKDQVPAEIEVGHMLQGNGPMGPVNVKVLEIKESTVVIDGNHPLAGQELIFDVSIVSIVSE